MKSTYFPQNQVAVNFFGCMNINLKGNKIIKKAPLFILGVVVVTPFVTFGRSFAKKAASDSYDWLKNKLTKNNSSPVVNKTLVPTIQSVAEVRSSAGDANYDDGRLIGKLLYQNDIAILYAPPGTGKTVLALQLAEAIASAGVCFVVPNDDDNDKRRAQLVLYYDGEMDDADYKNIYGEDNITGNQIVLIRKFYFKDHHEWMKDLKDRLDASSGDATIFMDNLSCICASTNGNTIREFFLNDLKVIQGQYADCCRNLTFVFLAHTNKDGDLAGSQNICNFGTTVLGMNATEDAPDLIKLSVIKNRKYGEMRGTQFLLQKKETDQGRKYMEYVEKIKTPPTKSNDEGKEFYELRQKGMTDKQIADMFGLSREHVNRRLNTYKKSIGLN